MAATVAFGLFTGLVLVGGLIGDYPRLLLPGIFFLALFVVWAFHGNRPPNQQLLRDAYMRRLGSHLNTPYIWGGETTSGIDCSGLARAALWEAMAKQGITQLNSRLLGPSSWRFWWRDISAKDMLEGKHGYTRVIGRTRRLAGYDTSKLKEGDLAVTSDGIHVLVYYGRGRWIEASPDDGKVVVNRAPKGSRRGWFNVPMTLVRWRILDAPRGSK